MISKVNNTKGLFLANHNTNDLTISKVKDKYYKIKQGVVELSELKILNISIYLVTVLLLDDSKRILQKIYTDESSAKYFIQSIKNKKLVV